MDDIAKFKKLNNTIDIGNNSHQIELKLKFRWSILLLEKKILFRLLLIYINHIIQSCACLLITYYHSLFIRIYCIKSNAIVKSFSNLPFQP